MHCSRPYSNRRAEMSVNSSADPLVEHRIEPVRHPATGSYIMKEIRAAQGHDIEYVDDDRMMLP